MATNLILKGELHSSSADLAEEKAIVKAGVDALVLETRADTGSTRVGSEWLVLPIVMLSWILESSYMSKDVLVELTEVQDGDVYYTRETDLDMIENTPFPIKFLAAGIFYLLLPASVWTGFLTGNQLFGSILLLWALIIPVLLIRLYNMKRTEASLNRDQLIANTIADAANNHGTVLAVVGAGHLSGVKQRLPDELDPEIHPPQYSIWSKSHFKEILLPAFKASLIIFSLYVLVVWLSINAVNYLTFAIIQLFS